MFISSLQLKRPGFAMPLVILMIVVLFAVGTGLLGLGYSSRILAIQNVSDIQARSAADAGLAKAIFEMNEKLKVKPWDDSTLPTATNVTVPNCDTVFSYKVTVDGGGVYTVESTGSTHRAERTVTAALRLKSHFDFALFAKANLGLKNSTVVDWYNYGDDDWDMQVGTNGTAADMINLWGTSIVNGDVIVGYGGDPDEVIDVKDNATITGQTYASTQVHDMTPMTVPEWLQSLPDGGAITGDTTIVDSGKYSAIDLKSNKKLTIDGDVTLYIIDGVTLGNEAVLEIVDAATNPDASLTLYLGGNFEGKNSSNVNNATSDAKKLKIYGLDTCENISLKNSTDFYGAIYAPNADVVMNNSAEFFGALVAENFEQKNSAKFNYDASLRDVGLEDDPDRFVVGRWRE